MRTKIEIVDGMPIIDGEPLVHSGEGVEHLLSQMSPDTVDAIRGTLVEMVHTLASDNGAMVVIFDTKGSGTAKLMAMGNQLIIPLLLDAAAQIGQRMYASAEGPVQ